MKNLLLIFASFLFCFQFASAQTSKGNFMLGGGVGFGFSNTNTTTSQTGIDDQIGETTTTSLDIIPKVGYFIADDIAAGIQMEFTSLTAKTENEKNVSSKILAGPFARYYYGIGEDTNKAIFFEANVGFGRTSVSEGNNDLSTSLFGFGVGPGITIFSNDFIGLEALAKYNWVRGVTEANDVVNTELVSEFDLSVGFQIYFARMMRAARN